MKATTRPSSGSSSDSEDDEEFNKLKDAVDPEFQSNFAGQKDTKKSPRGECAKPKESKRKAVATEWEAGHFVHPLKLTPASQEFIAKQLSSALDKKIKEIETCVKYDIDEEDEGILLFRDSTRRLRAKDLTREERKKSKRQRKRFREESKASSDEEETEAKLRAVAVSADWVKSPSTL